MISPSESSNNEVEANDESYTINGETTAINEDDDYAEIYGNSHYDVGNVDGNTVNVNGGTTENTNVYGGSSAYSDVIGNTVNINADVVGGVCGGETPGNSTGNVVNIYNGTVSRGVTGGGGSVVNGTSFGDITNNIVNLYNGTVNGSILGGSHVGSGNVTGNTVNIYGGTAGDFVYGGDSYSGDVLNNAVNVNAGNLRNIYGGSSNYGNVTGNTVNISGGVISGDIYGGLTYTGNVTDNKINISGSPDLSSAYLWGFDSGTASHSGNTLNLYAKGITAQNLSNFDAINVYIPADIRSGETILELAATGTDLSGTSIRAGIVADGGTTLTNGDSVTLIRNAGTITTDGASYGTLTDDDKFQASGTLQVGVSTSYDITVEKSGENSIIARIGDIVNEDNSGGGDDSGDNLNTDPTPSPPSINNRVRIIYPSPGPMLIQTTIDTDWLPPKERDFEEDDDELYEQAAKANDNNIFLNAGGGNLNTKTGDNGHVKMTHHNYELGWARTNAKDANHFIIAPIVDYATGNYDNYLKDGTHGSGNVKYTAGGVIARDSTKSGFYYEGSFRAGRIKNDFASDNLDRTGNFGTITYNASATAFAGHVRLGKKLRMDRNNLLDVYGIYFHAHQGGMNADLSSGEHYRIDAADNSRARLGYRLTTRTSKISRIYTGLAYQYEHNNGMSALFTQQNLRTPSTGGSGSSGMLELGWQIKPRNDNPWMVDLNATGWAGHQKGVTAMAKVQKSF